MTQAHLLKPGKTTRFTAVVQQVNEASSRIPLPDTAMGDLHACESTVVEGVLNGFPFRGVLDWGEEPALRISKAVQDAAGLQPGDTVSVEITRVGDEEETRVPQDLSEALAAAPAAQALFESVTPMARREWIRWVASGKQEATRAIRIQKGIDMLHHGKKRPCCFPGVNWVTKDLVSPEETWIPLPNSKK